MIWTPVSAAFAACVVSLFLTGASIVASRKLRLLDQPDARKVHKLATPRLGGVGIIGAALLVGVPAFALLRDASTPAGNEETLHYLALAVGAMCVFVVGVIDDLCGVSSQLKLLSLLAASCVVSASGAGFHSLSSDAVVIADIPTWLSWVITAVWITGMAVAFNFIDGLDGLSGGIALLAFATLGYFQLDNHNFAASVPSLVVAGAVLGFLHYNRSPAKTFMGDGGSLTLGYLIGALTLAANSDPNLGSMRAIVVPSLAMSVAIIDAAVTMFRRRYQQRRSMFTAERGHIHHRLLDRGLKPAQAVLAIHLVSAAAVAVGFFSLGFDGWSTLGGLALVVPLLWGLFHAAGSVRTGEMVSAIRQKRLIDKTSRRYRRVFEQLQLEFDGADCVSTWWQSVCDAAERLHFSRVELPIDTVDGECRRFRWIHDPETSQASCERIDAKIPIPLVGAAGATANADVQVPILSSLESAGERLALFSRLMAENGYAALQRIHRSETVKEAQHGHEAGEFGRFRVALVHDEFRAYGGAEQVVEQLVNLFPHADVFALVDFLPEDQRAFLRGKKVHATFLQKLPFARAARRAYLPLTPLAIEQLDVSDYDLVISSSSLAAKGVITGPDQLHLCYCHGPARQVWDLQHACLADAGLGYGPRGVVARAVLHYLRNWDARSANGVDHFIASSKAVARRIEKTYRRDAEVVYPPVDTDAFVPVDAAERDDYYLAVSKPHGERRIDLVVNTFNRSPKRRLIVLAEGAELERLQTLAGVNVEVLAWPDRPALVRHLQRARAFVSPGGEDDCRETVEAMACGAPIVAFHGGAVTEVLPPGVAGVFFENPTVESLLAALARLEESEPVDEGECNTLRRLAERCSVDQFVERMGDSVRKLVHQHWGQKLATAADAANGAETPTRADSIAENLDRWANPGSAHHPL